MLLSKKRPLKDPATSLVINTYPIERVKEFKFLGHVIEEHFSWKAHIQYITSNISKMIGLLTKLRKTFDVETLHSLYFAFIHSGLFNKWYHSLGVSSESACKSISKTPETFNRL